jgi:hypothetical protein
VLGELIGGPTLFYGAFQFTAYRADITALGLVNAGSNTLTLDGLEYVGTDRNNENDGAGILVIYDDGTTADIQLVDGLDLAYFDFLDPLDAAVPQTFTFPALAEPVTADLAIFAGSVGADRPNEIRVTVDGDVQSFFDLLGSVDGPLWDTALIEVPLPAGATSLTVEPISTPSEEPRGASLSWVAGALSVPVPEEPELAGLGDFVWEDLNMDGIQDEGEPGVPGVVVHLMDCAGNVLDETVTDADGLYAFLDLEPGDYSVHFVLPDGYVFTLQDQGGDDAFDSDADMNGYAACTTLDPGEYDPTWDAGIYIPLMEGCSHTIGYWKTHAGFGPQDDVVTPLLPIWLGDDDGDKSLAVTTAQIAVDVLEQKTYGKPNNGITKLYAQLLGAKLSIADGASDMDVADVIADADAFLADNDWEDWDGLSEMDRDMVEYWHETLDLYNNGYIGPGHCDEEEYETSSKLLFEK